MIPITSDGLSHWINGESSNPAWLAECRLIEGEGLIPPIDDDHVRIVSRDAIRGEASMESEA